MGLKRQIERLRHWACEKVNDDCRMCNFVIDDGDIYYSHYCCPYDNVIKAAEDRAKEGK